VREVGPWQPLADVLAIPVDDGEHLLRVVLLKQADLDLVIDRNPEHAT
jgi:hypothetical protein